MSLVERLERLAKLLDRERWETSHYDRRGGYVRGGYNIEAVETADLLIEAAKTLRGYSMLVDQARTSMAKH